MWGAGYQKKGETIMVIGDVLTAYEKKSELLFDGESGRWVLSKLQNAGVNLKKCFFTKAIKECIGNDKPTKAQKKEAYDTLMEEINELQPKAIFALGSITLDVLTKTTAITKNRGKVIDIGGFPAVFTYNPRAMIRDAELMKEFNFDVEYFSKLANDRLVEEDIPFTLITTRAQFNKLFTTATGKRIAYDIETPPGGGLPHMVGICVDGWTYVVPFADYACKMLDCNFEQDDIAAGLTGLFRVTEENSGHYTKFDNRNLEDFGVKVKCGFDTFIAAYVLNETEKGLKALSKTYCDAIDYNEGIEFKERLNKEEFIKQAIYCGKDVYYTAKLRELFGKRLEEMGVDKVFWYILMPVDRVFSKMERNGAYINQDKMVEITELYNAKRAECRERLLALLPPEFKDINLNSSAQLRKLLFDHLGLPPVDLTDGGDESTGKATLIHLAEEHEIPKLILEYRKYEKSLCGFLDPWREYVKQDGRLHTTYNIARTSTGRPSAENPNLQQVPRDKKVRTLVSAPPGRLLVQADYSQIELRTASVVFGVETMKAAYRRGEDIHRKTAASVARCAPEDVTYEMRTGAKAVNFGYLYGMWWTAFKEYAFLTYGVKVTDAEAKNSREVYFETYPELVTAHERQRREVKTTKQVKTMTGFIRLLPNVDSPDKDLRGKAERQAINTPVQSLAAHMMFLAMILIDDYIEKHYAGRALLVGQIHDAILVEADEDIAGEIGIHVKRLMESVDKILKKYFGINFDVPIVSDVEIGSGWGVGDSLEKFLKGA